MKPIIDRLLAKIKRKRGTGCWIWQGSLNPRGYGQMSAGRRGESPRLTHRVAWEFYCGEIPDDLCVLHKCDNRKCVNPDHLFLGTEKQNSEDMVRKNRESSGERHPYAKLTVRLVRRARRLHAAGVPMTHIAQMMDVSTGTIQHVVHRRTWKKVA
jgi:hypothetical protein